MSKPQIHYRIIDHRAPWYVFRGDPLFTVERRFFGTVVPLSGAAMIFLGWGLAEGMLWMTGLTVFLVVLCVWAVRQQVRWAVGVPRPGVDDWRIKEDLVKMQGRYACQPVEMQKIIEPVLIRAYALARVGDSDGVRDRDRAVKTFIDEMSSRKLADRSDLELLEQVLDGKRQMKREGLL